MKDLIHAIGKTLDFAFHAGFLVVAYSLGIAFFVLLNYGLLMMVPGGPWVRGLVALTIPLFAVGYILFKGGLEIDFSILGTEWAKSTLAGKSLRALVDAVVIIVVILLLIDLIAFVLVVLFTKSDCDIRPWDDACEWNPLG
jgi:hypothetical protein